MSSRESDWKEDSEAQSIAMDVISKYDEMFDGIDLTRIRFIRIYGKAGKACKVNTVPFPMCIDVPYLYYIEINDGNWTAMTEAQRNLVVFSALFEIAPGGMDPDCSSYGKKRKRDIEDFSEVVAAAGGRYDWKEIGSEGIHDILVSDGDKKDMASLFGDGALK